MRQIKFKKTFHSLKLAAKFRYLSIAIIGVITVVIILTFTLVLQSIIDNISKDYARLYAENAVKTLNTYLNGEIALIRKTAGSDGVIEWFKDENNPDKKLQAYKEMQSTMKASSSKNLYIGVNKTLHEFPIELSMEIDEIQPVATLSTDLPKDNWYFECTSNDKEYLLNVDIDKVYHRKRVWLNYKVENDGEVYGAICTALEFSDLVEQLFLDYSNKGVRSFIIDETGIIQMDSDLIGDENFLTSLNTENNITAILEDSEFQHSVKQYTKTNLQNYTQNSMTTVLKLTAAKYNYATFAPIENTTWAVVTLYNSAALFKPNQMAPLFLVIIMASVAFILALNRAVSIFILNPFGKLVTSMDRVKGNLNEQMHGTDMSDEIGQLARSIQNMKDNLIDVLGKVNYDSLTGIYNRRYLDDTLGATIKTLSQSNMPISLIMVDIDFFKKYNDIYGHSQGDECLKTVANVLSNSIGHTGDFVARYGGEEFIIVLPNTNEDEALLVINKIYKNLKTANIPHIASEIEPYVTISMGIVSNIANFDIPYIEYIKRADEALYLSKQNGRNRYTFKALQ